MQRILFVSEAVTLAQVVRLATLARALDPARYEVHFASARFPEAAFAGTSFRRHAIASLTPEQVERAVRWGTRIYSRRRLARYVEDDLRVLDAAQPALVVGDLRWSLLVSAPLRGVPLASLVNAYWSPHARRSRFPLPDHPIVRLLGERLAAEHFPTALPFVFRHFVRPLDALRRRARLAPLGDLLQMLVAGDWTLYADAPGLVPMDPLPPTHLFLGAVQWAPRPPPPPWWDALDEQRPSVYVTLGSSGRAATLPKVVEAVASLPVNVLVATAGRVRLASPSAHVHVADYLPGDEAARRSAVVVHNGGSSTGYQALAEGRPVVGLPWNLDQYLAMTAIEDLGAGRLVRGSTADPVAVRAAVEAALSGAFDAGAATAREALAGMDSGAEFRRFVERALGASPRACAPRVAAEVPA